MVDKTVEEKVNVVTNFFDLLKVPDNSWVKINGKNEFKIRHDNLMASVTLYTEGNYVCKNTYNSFLASMTPLHIEKFLKRTGGAVNYLRILKEKGGLDL